MDGSEDSRVRTPEDEDPRWLKNITLWRRAFDLLFPPVVAVMTVAAVPVIWFTPELQTPQGAGTIAGMLLAAAGVLIKQKKP